MHKNNTDKKNISTCTALFITVNVNDGGNTNK